LLWKFSEESVDYPGQFQKIPWIIPSAAVDEKHPSFSGSEPLLTTSKQIQIIHTSLWIEKMRFIFVQKDCFPLPTGVFPTFNSPYYLLLLKKPLKK